MRSEKADTMEPHSGTCHKRGSFICQFIFYPVRKTWTVDSRKVSSGRGEVGGLVPYKRDSCNCGRATGRAGRGNRNCNDCWHF